MLRTAPQNSARTTGKSLRYAVLMMFAWALAAMVQICSASAAEKLKAEASSQTPDYSTELRDTFHGKYNLNWKIIREDKDHLSLTKNPGHLTITTQRGTIHGDVEHDALSEGIRAKNIFVVRNPLTPSSDFSMTLAVSKFEPTACFQQVGLICYDDDENYVKWSYEYSWRKDNTITFVLVRQTKMEPEHDLVVELPNPGKFWMRITKRGDQYECAYSTDGRDFTVAGSRPWGTQATKYLGFLAKNGGNPQAGEIDVCIDSFELRSLPSKHADGKVVPRDLLDGVWTGVNLQIDGVSAPWNQYRPLRMVFAKDKVTLRMRDKTVFESAYKVDAGKTPHAIDFVSDKPTLGIYRFEAGILAIGIGQAEQQRPSRFTAGSSSSPWMLIELQRGDFSTLGSLMTVVDADDATMHKLTSERRFDFRGSHFDRKLLHFNDAEAEQYVKATPDGLLASVPAGKRRWEAGVIPWLRVHGDFEITASFEIRELAQPDAGDGVGPTVCLWADSKEGDAVSLGRMRRVDEGEVYAIDHAIYKEGADGKKREQSGRLYATKTRAGRLRLVRFGNVLRYLVADAENREFRQLGQIDYSTADIKTIDIALKLQDASTAATVLWKDVVIRAEGLEDTAAGLTEKVQKP
ncbi:MAG: DUF1583 domain-containing protein [Thermoguttaceae bacterium]